MSNLYGLWLLSAVLIDGTFGGILRSSTASSEIK